MKPDVKNGNLPLEARPLRVLIISGSDRRQYNCSGVDSKSCTLMLRIAERLPQEWEIDYEDLGNLYARADSQLQCLRFDFDGALCLAVFAGWWKGDGHQSAPHHRSANGR